MNNPLPVSFEEKVQLATRTPEPRPEFAEELWRQIEAHPRPQQAPSRRAVRLFSRPVWAAAAAILIVVIGIALVGPQKVAAAFRALWGYVPGIGFVQDTAAIRMVDVPVRAERDGVVLVVENGMADAQGVHLSLTLEGLPAETPIFLSPLRGKEEEPYLRLPSSGQRLQLIRALTSRGRAQYVFEAVPMDDQVTLVLPVVPGLRSDPTGGDWLIPLKLRASNQDDRILASFQTQMTSEKSRGITLTLEEVAQDVDTTMLKVRVDTGDPSITPNSEWWEQLSLTGQDGKIYPLTDVPVPDSDNVTVRVLKTSALNGTEQLSLTLRSLDLVIDSGSEKSAPGFLFDPGQNPEIGDSWDLNETVEINEYRLHFTRAQLTREDAGGIELLFSAERQPGVSGFLLGCGARDGCTGSRSNEQAAGADGQSSIHSSLAFDQLPAQPIQVSAATLMVSVEGLWRVDWQPLVLSPALLTRPTATPTPSPLPPTLTPTAVIRQPVAEKVLPLLGKSFSALYGQPGWVHIVSENIEDAASGFVGPKHTVGEYWQYVDAEGKITRYALVVKDASGGIWQTIARVGAKQVNFTTQTASEDATLIEQAKRDRLPEDIELTVQQGGRVHLEETLLDGKPVWLITLINEFNPPITYAGTDWVVRSTERKIWIEQDTGFILLRERTDYLTDGRAIVLQRLRTLTQERVDTPPPDILYYLNQVEMP